MRYFKILIVMLMLISIYSCSTLKEGFTNPKKKSSDEFLVEKKSPLVMPPDFDDLPSPKPEKNLSDISTNIKDLVTNSEKNTSISENSNETDKSFENKLLEKIKKN